MGRPDEPAVLEFFGDDDVFVFINGQIALEIGGIHRQESGIIDLDAEAGRLGLEVGNTYTMQIFHAERQTVHSNFKLQTNLNLFGDRTFISTTTDSGAAQESRRASKFVVKQAPRHAPRCSA